MAGAGALLNSEWPKSSQVHVCRELSMCVHQWEDVSMVSHCTKSEAGMCDVAIVVQFVYG